MLKRRTKSGFTLIELLVVLLVLSILVSIALPSYLSSVKDSRHKTANHNTKVIATAIESLYVRGNGITYTNITDEDIRRDLSGTIPINPCTGDASYFIEKTTTRVVLQADAGQNGNCDQSKLATLVLSGS